MMIEPSATIRNNYRKVADYCIETGNPVFLTNNGEAELVVMSIQAWEERQGILVEESLLQIEAQEKEALVNYTSAEKVFTELERIIDEVEETSL